MTWYWEILIFSQNYYLALQTLLQDNGDIFRVYTYQSYSQILHFFQISITNTDTIINTVTNINIFRELLSNYTSFLVHVHQYWYFVKVIIQLYIFFTVHIKHYWQRKLSEPFSNNIDIIWELLSNSTVFFRVYLKQ